MTIISQETGPVYSSFRFQIFSGSEFNEFLTRREVKMQKTTEGLGLMIIEGKQKALNRRGIFISDIQQDSLAYRVNKTHL